MPNMYPAYRSPPVLRGLARVIPLVGRLSEVRAYWKRAKSLLESVIHMPQTSGMPTAAQARIAPKLVVFCGTSSAIFFTPADGGTAQQHQPGLEEPSPSSSFMNHLAASGRIKRLADETGDKPNPAST